MSQQPMPIPELPPQLPEWDSEPIPNAEYTDGPKRQRRPDSKKTDDSKLTDPEWVYIGRIRLLVTDMRDIDGTVSAFNKTKDPDTISDISSDEMALMTSVVSRLLIQELQSDNPHIDIGVAHINVRLGSLEYFADILGRKDGDWKKAGLNLAMLSLLSGIAGKAVEPIIDSGITVINSVVVVAERWWRKPTCYGSDNASSKSSMEIDCEMVDSDLQAGLYYLTSSGDTAWRVSREISEIYDDHEPSQYQIAVALYSSNLDRFDGSINELKNGVALRIPSIDDIQKYSAEEAKKIFSDLTKSQP